jgi:transposase, IS5 family
VVAVERRRNQRHRRQLQPLRTRLGRPIRDIGRKIAGHADLQAAFTRPLSYARQIRSKATTTRLELFWRSDDRHEAD